MAAAWFGNRVGRQLAQRGHGTNPLAREGSKRHGSCQPAIVFGLMGVQVVENDMNLAAGIGGDDTVHEIQELDAPTAPVMAGFDLL